MNEGEEASAEMLCRCPGLEGDSRCEDNATEEDGLCDNCRCEHGCCVDHGHPKARMSFSEWMGSDRPEGWIEDVTTAWQLQAACRGRRIEQKVLADEAVPS